MEAQLCLTVRRKSEISGHSKHYLCILQVIQIQTLSALSIFLDKFCNGQGEKHSVFKS